MKYKLTWFFFFSLSILPPAFANTTFANTKWRTTKSKHITFRYPHRWSNIVKPLIQNAPRDLKMLEKAFGVKYKGQLKVRFSSPGKSFSRIQPHGWRPSSDIAGLAYPKRSLITMRIKSIEGASALKQTFQHELSHIMLSYAANGHQIPLWFNEGTAMMLSRDFGGFERFKMLTLARIAGQLLHLNQLKYRFPAQPSERKQAYALSLDAVLFLTKQKEKTLPLLFQYLREGATFQQAIKQAIGTPFSKLQKQWRNNLSMRYGWIPLIANEGTIWMFMIILFFMAYAKVKKQRRAQLAAMEEVNTKKTDIEEANYGELQLHPCQEDQRDKAI